MDYAQQQRNPARHWLGLSFVALLHVVVIYALVNGLAHKIVDAVRKPIETVIVKESAPPPPPPPSLVLPPPKMDVPPPPFVPAPEIPIPVPPPQHAITQVVRTPPPVPVAVRPAPPRPVQVTRTRPALDRSSCATAEPEYPMSSRRSMESGTVVLRIEIGINGMPARVEIARSSGYERLDVAAREWIASCRFRAATVDSKPVSSWVAQAYTFTLQD